MLHHPEQVLPNLMKFAQEIKLKRGVEGLIYREDYRDYRIYLEGNFHIEIREKLIDLLMKNPKHGDTRRELTFLLENALAFEEWESDGVEKARGEAPIEIDRNAD